MFVEIPKTIGINWFYRFVNSRRLMLLYGCLWHMFVETLEKATGMDLVHQVVNWYTLIGNGCCMVPCRATFELLVVFSMADPSRPLPR